MPSSVTVPSKSLFKRIITFDETGIKYGNRRIEYNDITDIRLFGTDWYLNSWYRGRWWVVEIASERRSIKARFQGYPATPSHEAYDQIYALVQHHVTPNLINRVVAMVQDPKADFMFGPVRLTHAGISKSLFWPLKSTLNWSDFVDCRWQGTRVQIRQKQIDGKSISVWWSGSYKINMGCVFSQVVAACHRAGALNDTRTAVIKGSPPRAISTSPEFAAAKILLTDRPVYLSDGGFHLILFPIAILSCWAASFATAAGLSYFQMNGLYYFFLTPFFTVFVLRMILMFFIRLASCRNAFLGGALGLSCGLICFFGHFLCNMLWYDPTSILHLDQFLNYVQDSILNTKIVHNSGEEYRNSGEAILYTAIDFVVIMWLTTSACFTQARAAWCRESRDWMKREVVRTSAGKSSAFILAFSNLDPAPIRGLLYRRSAQSNRVHTRIMVEYSPRFTGMEPHTIYLSVSEYRYETMFSVPFPKNGEIYRLKFTRREIERVLKIFRFEPNK